MRQFFCSNRTYNDMATLFFNPQEAAIHQLFHQDGPSVGAAKRNARLVGNLVVMATEIVCVAGQVPSVP